MAVESIRGNLSTTCRLRANLAVGGGSDVSITPTYNSGMKIADYTIDGSEGEIFIPNYPDVETEIISITPGNETTSRSFTFSKTPKFLKCFYKGAAWCLDFSIVWGQDYYTYLANQQTIAISGDTGGVARIFYNDNTMTLTAGNAFAAMNNSDGSGYIFVIY